MLTSGGESCKFCGKVRAVKFVTPKAWIRIVIAAVVLGLALWFGGRYSCRCEGRDARTIVPATVKPETLRVHVEAIASREHNVFHPEQLRLSAEYIEQQWRAQGYAVSRQTYRMAG